jgi:hypothetical protein
MHVAINTHYPSDAESGRVIEILAQQQQPRCRSLHKQLSHLISMPHKSSGSSHGITSEILITAAVHLKRRCRGDENVRARRRDTCIISPGAPSSGVAHYMDSFATRFSIIQLHRHAATIYHAGNAGMHRRVLSLWRALKFHLGRRQSLCAAFNLADRYLFTEIHKDAGY